MNAKDEKKLFSLFESTRTFLLGITPFHWIHPGQRIKRTPSKCEEIPCSFCLDAKRTDGYSGVIMSPALLGLFDAALRHQQALSSAGGRTLSRLNEQSECMELIF